MSELDYNVPELPKGFYFFVSDSARWSRQGYLLVRLMRKRRWSWDKCVDEEDGVGVVAGAVHYAMDVLKFRHDKRQREHNLYGAYPPKKLGST